jgi:hypothetical protein
VVTAVCHCGVYALAVLIRWSLRCVTVVLLWCATMVVLWSLLCYYDSNSVVIVAVAL